MAKVMIGAPVRDRDWILNGYLRHILGTASHYSDKWEDEIRFCFILNDSTDGSKEHLEKFARVLDLYGYQDIYNIIEFNQGAPKDQRISSVRNNIYSSLANVRNKLLEEFLKSDCDYLFSVDTDIIVPPYTLSKLISRNKDVIAAHIWNTEDRRYPNFMKRDPLSHRFKHILDFEPGTMFEVDLTGAVYLIRRRVIEAGVRYDYHKQGEDVPFCQATKDLGFEIWVDTSIYCEHYLNKDRYIEDRRHDFNFGADRDIQEMSTEIQVQVRRQNKDWRVIT